MNGISDRMMDGSFRVSGEGGCYSEYLRDKNYMAIDNIIFFFFDYCIYFRLLYKQVFFEFLPSFLLIKITDFD